MYLYLRIFLYEYYLLFLLIINLIIKIINLIYLIFVIELSIVCNLECVFYIILCKLIFRCLYFFCM